MKRPAIDPQLVSQLRIDKNDREDVSTGPPAWLWVLIGLVLLAVLAGAGAWWWSQRPVEVQVALARANGGRGAGAVLQATGYVTAKRQATVSTQITGTLKEVLIEEGQAVQAGQVLARLDDSAPRASLNAAAASAEASAAQVVQLQAQLAQAEADARRTAELASNGVLSKQAAEQSATSVRTLAAQLNAARKSADAAQAQLAQAKVNFDFTVVKAPFAGVVTEKAAQVGEIVSPLSAGGGFTRTGVGTIVDMDSLEVDVDVNEAYIGQVQPGMAVESVLGAYPDWRIPSHVIAIVPTADKGKATVKVRIALEQKDSRIVPNMGVRVSFLQKAGAADKPAAAGVLVPPAAVVQRDGRSVVFLAAQGRASLRAVTAAPQAIDGQTLLTQGLSAGDAVVLSPPDSLRDGAAIATGDK